MPKVSVVLPTYNNASYIGEALASVFRQTYKDYEVVVIDDGSTDGTREKLKPFLSSIKYIYQENRGRGAARQRGVLSSCGEYIAFIDSDDIWMPHKLEKQMDCIAGSGFNGFLHSRVSCIDASGRPLRGETNRINRAYNHALKRGYDYISLLNECPLFFSSAVISRNMIIESGGFNESYALREDLEFILRFSRNHKISFLGEPLVYYRIRPATERMRMSKKIALACISILREELRYVREASLGDPAGRLAERHILGNLINYEFSGDNVAGARNHLRELLKKEPYQFFTMKNLKNLMKVSIYG